jgi:hypothetical protein
VTHRRSIPAWSLVAMLTPAAIGAQTDSAWTIPGGSYAGQTVAINTSSANGKRSKFWRLSSINGKRRIVGWNPSSLPARVAFRPGLGVTSADSAAFWSILAGMEEDFGMRLFVPALLERGSDPDDVIVIDVKSMGNDDGMTLVTWSSHGSLYDPRVYLRSTSLLRDQRIVTHEMMHALGFGHTSAWTSVMNVHFGPARVTAEDVAYAQHALYSRRASESEDLWEKLNLAAERLRW